MNLYVYKRQNDALIPISIIDYATSIIWVKRYNEAGQFELYIAATDDLLQMFTDETYLMRDNDNTVMVAERVHLTTDAENGDYLTISGRSAECLIGRRIVPQQTNFSNTSAEIVMRTLMNQNIINPTKTSRKMPMIGLAALKGYTEMIANKQIMGKNLLEAMSDLAKEQNYGFRLFWQKSNQKFLFEVYKGVDRSFDQSVNPPVVFSPAFENLGNTSYERDTTTYYNYVYVGGQGEGSDRIIVGVATSPVSGMDMREKWVDARGTSSTTDGGTLSPTDYARVLAQQGSEEIGISKETTSFSGEILDYNVYQYGVDYDLGDKVQIVNEYGIKGTATVTEITEVEDEEGYRIYPTLSTWEA